MTDVGYSQDFTWERETGDVYRNHPLLIGKVMGVYVGVYILFSPKTNLKTTP